MTTSTCAFCAHANPARAKFCNECASPLNMQPCRECEAVNARHAPSCHHCGAAMQPVADPVEAPTERIVAEADATLATLNRELALATHASSPDAATDTSPVAAPETIAMTVAALKTVEATKDSVEVGTAHVVVDLPSEEALIAARPHDREWRPERRSRGVAVALGVAVFAIAAAALYVVQDPTAFERWMSNIAAPAQDQPPSSEPAPAIATPAETQAPAAASPSPGGTASAAPVRADDKAPPPAATAETSAPPAVAQPGEPTSPPAETPQPPTATRPVAVPQPPPRNAKSTQTRAKAATQQQRARDRARARRAAQSQAPSAPQPSSVEPRRAEACTEALASLGLCVR